MNRKSYRRSNITLNLTPHYKAKKFAGGGFENISSASITQDDLNTSFGEDSAANRVKGTFMGIEGMLDAGLSNAKLKSTYNIQSDIADNMGLAMQNQNLKTNDSLMAAWDEYNPMNHVSRKDIRGGSTFGRIWNTNMASIKGAEAGWNASKSPYGAIIGGVIGLGSGIAGWITGGRKASRLRDKLNTEIDRSNELAYQSLSHLTSRAVQRNLMMAEGNYAAYGGPLDKRLAGHQMQNIYNNGTPSANRYASGGNVNTAVTATVPQVSSAAAALMPYLARVRKIRESDAIPNAPATLPEQTPLRVDKEVQMPVEDSKPAFKMPTEETKAEMREYIPSNELIDSILQWEGFLERPSNKLDGIWTVGYGDTDKELNDYYLKHPDKKMTKEEARERAAYRIRTEFLDYAKRLTPNWDKLTNPQKDAIVSYIYNVGPGAFKNKHPRLQKALRELNYDAIAENLSAGYNNKKMPGLRRRRNFERLAFYYPEMTTYGVIPEGATLRQFEPNDSPANKLRYETLGIKQPKTGNVPAMYTLDYLNSLPSEQEKAENIWGF